MDIAALASSSGSDGVPLGPDHDPRHRSGRTLSTTVNWAGRLTRPALQLWWDRLLRLRTTGKAPNENRRDDSKLQIISHVQTLL